MRCHTQWFSEQHHDSCGFVSFRLRLRGSPPRHLYSRDPLLSVFVFGFSIILHGFEFVTNNDNKMENNNIGKIEEVGLVCCWKRRIGFEFFWVFWVRWVRQKVKKKWRGGYISYAPIGLDISTLANATSFSKITVSKASNLFPFLTIRSTHALNCFLLKFPYFFFFAACWVECCSVLCALFSGFLVLEIALFKCWLMMDKHNII